ncbi:hypothetical protein JOM56_007189 [Amanita muscaria]
MKRKIDRLKQAPALKIKMPQLLLYNRNKINFLQPWRPTKEAELIRARDDAFAQVKTATEEAQKAADDIRNIRLQNNSKMGRTTGVYTEPPFLVDSLPGKILVNPGKVLVLVKFRDLVQAWYKPGDGKKVYKIAFFDISKVVLCQQLGTLYEVFVSVYLDMNEDDKKDHVHHSRLLVKSGKKWDCTGTLPGLLVFYRGGDLAGNTAKLHQASTGTLPGLSGKVLAIYQDFTVITRYGNYISTDGFL